MAYTLWYFLIGIVFLASLYGYTRKQRREKASPEDELLDINDRLITARQTTVNRAILIVVQALTFVFVIVAWPIFMVVKIKEVIGHR